jgi:transposase
VRVTTAFNRLLRLDGVHVRQVDIGDHTVTVTVALRRKALVCPHCSNRIRTRYDTRLVDSRWRHLDLGAMKLEVRARLRRLRCPSHGVVVEAVPFARPAAGFTRDFDDLVAWLATRTDKTAITKLLRISWRTVGRICERVVADVLDEHRLDGLFVIGVDEISWRKQHHYLTLVSNHQTSKIVWAGPGKTAKTLDGFFAELGPERTKQLEAVSLDLGPAFNKSVTKNAPDATICADPYHLVALANRAVDTVRRDIWQQLRRLPDPGLSVKFKRTRWALLKHPDTLTDSQQATLRLIRRHDSATWRAYQLKESLRDIVTARDIDEQLAATVLDRWAGWAQRSRLEPFVRLARTIRLHRDSILATIRLGWNNGRVEGLNNRVRLISRRGFGFHSAEAVAALVMLSCGPVTLRLPYEPRTA